LAGADYDCIVFLHSHLTPHPSPLPQGERGPKTETETDYSSFQLFSRSL
jgi:hypothetical protein